MQAPEFSWANGAAQCGYYDQAHLIRDFRDFSGEAPVALVRGDTDLARHFLQDGARENVAFFQD
jgi:AraC-like DNA-binding protein